MMAELRCKAVHCMYNKDKYCSKGDILVGGKHASNSDETCCQSFAERKENSVNSAMCHPSETIYIDCEASKCMYNADYKCFAERVEINGSNACCCKDTACATFKENK